MTYKRKEVIGDCTLYLGDCLEILPTIDKVDAVVTDPPYGIGADKGLDGFGGVWGFGGCLPPIARTQYDGCWDDVRPDKAVFDAILEGCNVAVIFGGNYFTDILPVGRQWFVWDKKNTMPSFSDCELAWTNINRKSVKLLTYEYNGLIGKREKRVHPTQKPVVVMKWCIKKLPKGSHTVLDPFLGSGTTLVACAHLGLGGVGIEVNEEFFNIACERIQNAYDQPDLFVEQPKKAVQEGMDL